MLDGGRVRRRSLDSGIDHSPCQGRKANGLYLQNVGRVLDFSKFEDDTPLPTPLPVPELPAAASPAKVVVSKPSIASTSSEQFGDDRMISARNGYLKRNSLEESALMAQGEELLASCK